MPGKITRMTSIYLSPETDKALAEIRNVTKMKNSEIIRRAVKMYAKFRPLVEAIGKIGREY